MDRIYKTSEVAKIVGVHSNTVRLYEKLELIFSNFKNDEHFAGK